MKVVGKIINTCALLLAGTVCSTQAPTIAHEKPMVTQDIIIVNATGDTAVYGGIYLTNLRGTKILEAADWRTFAADNQCWRFTIKKPADKRSTEYHRIILTTDYSDANNIAKGTAKKSTLVSTRIKLFSGGKPLIYKVTKDKKGKLKIERDAEGTCHTFLGNITLDY